MPSILVDKSNMTSLGSIIAHLYLRIMHKYYFINIADRDIEGKLGESEFMLKPKEFALLAPEKIEVKGTREYCSALFSYYKEEKPHPFFSSTWRFNKAARSLVVFYTDPKTKNLKFHTVRNYIN